MRYLSARALAPASPIATAIALAMAMMLTNVPAHAVYEDVAKKLTDKYAAQGIHVYYCDQVYKPANDAFNDYLASKGYPPSLHGGLPDTAEMLYLDKDKTWVRRNLVPTAVGDAVVDGKAQAGPNSPHNGITGDARRSTAELGKQIFDMKVDYAVKQIQGFVASK